MVTFCFGLTSTYFGLPLLGALAPLLLCIVRRGSSSLSLLLSLALLALLVSMLLQLELSSEYPHREPPQSILTLSPRRVTPHRLQLHLLPPDDEELGSLRDDKDEGELRSKPELREDELEELSDDGGETSRMLKKDDFSNFEAKPSMVGETV